jgi:hypothetical protein
LIAPYWREGAGFSSTVTINNTFTRAIDVTPVVWTADGLQRIGSEIRIRAKGSLDIPVSTITGGTEGLGHMGLRYVGEPQELNAVLTVANARESLVLDHAFEGPEAFATSQLDGVFYLPRSSTHAEIALSNTSDGAIMVLLEVQPEGVDSTHSAKREVTVGSHQTAMVDMRPLLKGSNGQVPLAVRILLSYSGSPGDVRVHGMLQDPSGFSANMLFQERSAISQDKLFSPILPLKEFVSPVVVMANTNSDDVPVRLDLHYAIDGKSEDVTVRSLIVPRQGTAHIDLKREIQSLPEAATNLGISMAYSYANGGGFLADVLLIDESGWGLPGFA